MAFRWLVLAFIGALSYGADIDLAINTTSIAVSPGRVAYIDGTIRNSGTSVARLANVTASNVAPASVTLDAGFAALRDAGLAAGATYQGHLLQLTIPQSAPIGTNAPIHVRVDFGGQVLETDIAYAIVSQGIVYRLPQIAAGHLWATTVILANPTATAVDFTINFRGGDGNPLDVPFPALGTRRTITGNLAPGATQFFVADDGEPLTQGWAEVTASDRILVEAAYKKTIDGRADWESGSAGVASGTTRTVIYFDNSTVFTTSVAVANPNGAAEDLKLLFRDVNGVALGSATISLPPHGQATARTPSQFPFSADQRGTIEFTAGGQEIAVLGLRFNSNGGVVALPAF